MAAALMNPSVFESVYGFQMLDTVHNFFPELMYSDIFQSSIVVRWIQHRIETLFPEQYMHHKQLYRLYSAVPRRNEFTRWNQTTPEPARIPATPVRAPRVQPQSPPPIQRSTATASRTIPVRTNDPAGAEELMNILFGPLPATTTATYDIGNGLVNLLGLAALAQQPQQLFQDVPVFPTLAEIRAGSSEVVNANVPQDTSCTICREYEGDSTWLRLYCNHYFHRDCIEHWFTDHVNCPVCRADIRDASTSYTPPTGGDHA